MIKPSDAGNNTNKPRTIRIRFPMKRVMNMMNKMSIAKVQRIGYGACALSIILWVLLIGSDPYFAGMDQVSADTQLGHAGPSGRSLRGRLDPAPELAAANRIRLEYHVQHVYGAESGCFFVVRRNQSDVLAVPLCLPCPRRQILK